MRRVATKIAVAYHSNRRKKLDYPCFSFFPVFFSGCPRFFPVNVLRFVHDLRHDGNLEISQVAVVAVVAVHSKVKEDRDHEADAEHAQVQGGQDRPPGLDRIVVGRIQHTILPIVPSLLLLLVVVVVVVVVVFCSGWFRNLRLTHQKIDNAGQSFSERFERVLFFYGLGINSILFEI